MIPFDSARFQDILRARLAACEGASTFGAEDDFGAMKLPRNIHSAMPWSTGAARKVPPKAATPALEAQASAIRATVVNTPAAAAAMAAATPVASISTPAQAEASPAPASGGGAPPASGGGGGGDGYADSSGGDDSGGDGSGDDSGDDAGGDDMGAEFGAGAFAWGESEMGADAPVGTVAGFHTAADLRDILNAKSSEMNDLQRMRDNSLAAWKTKDPAGAADWDKDFSALSSRFLAARAKAVAASTIPGAPGLVATDQAYTAVLRAVKQAGDPGPRTKGDLADLADRLHAAGFDVQFRPVPQPTAADADLQAFQASGQLLQQVDPGLVGKPGLSTLEKVGIAGGIVALLVGGAYVYTMTAPLRR